MMPRARRFNGVGMPWNRGVLKKMADWFFGPEMDVAIAAIAAAATSFAEMISASIMRAVIADASGRFTANRTPEGIVSVHLL